MCSHHVRRAPRPLRLLLPRRRLAARRARHRGGRARLRRLRADRPQRVSGSMEFAQAAKASASRRSTGRRSTSTTAATSPCSSTRRRAGATSARSSRARTPTRVTTAASRRPSVPLETLEEHAAGLVCLSGCARQGVHDEPTLRRLLAAFGRDDLHVELQRPFQRDDRARNRRLAGLAERLGVAAVATGNVHAHARERAPLQDAFVALRNHTTLDASEPLRRGNTSHVLASPAAMAARFEDHPRGGRRGGGARRSPALRPHGRPRLPLPGLGGSGQDARARRAVLGADGRALPGRQPAPRRRARAGWRRSCA